MKRWFVLIIGLVVLSCNNERVIQLPDIENAEITEVQPIIFMMKRNQIQPYLMVKI
ncbi:MAG: hypothetical protein HRU49_09465 [Winogradskyella sp.]|uniref:hypothetical protein n=1 Tax=Winogradskyella sp. TaxID=1883156 RepID=UPI0025EB2FA5|nr:hypothetical protein [Winogradskyella sp.]NRB83984.1 hypothetical protein [Winogradskyella sp.]